MIANSKGFTFLSIIAISLFALSLSTIQAGEHVGVVCYLNGSASVVGSVNPNMELYPKSIIVNPAGTRVYVANSGSNNISVIDTTSNTVINTVDVGEKPGHLAGNPAGTRIYVANSGSNNISVIDTTSNTVINTVDVGEKPAHLAVNPAGTRVYVTNSASNSICVIDIPSNTVIDTINVGT
jgi:YVTN family beta-propeller protein